MSESTAVTPIAAMRSTLTKMSDDFRAALPPQIPVDKFIRTTLTAIQMQPALLDADRRSLLGSCMKAAQDGLVCDGREAALVMFGQTVQYMPMVGGILKKIRNSGELASIAAHVVYENDQFDYALGDFENFLDALLHVFAKAEHTRMTLHHALHGGAHIVHAFARSG